MSCVLRTLGEFSFTVDGRTGQPPSTQKARALMAFLVRHHGERISRERLIEHFWPDADADRGRQSLSTALWSIRRTLRECGRDPADFLATDAMTVTWRLATTLDSLEFQRLAHAGDRAALEWYRGEFLPGDYDEWPSSERERILNDLETLLGELVANTGSVDAAQRLLKIDPFSEPAYRALIDAEIAAGRVVAARTLAERFMQVLRDNRLTPSAEFLARITALGTHACTTLPSAFVGRAEELAAFTAFTTARDQHVMLVLGNAGFGKSTLAEKFAERATELGHGVARLAVRADSQNFGGWEHIYAEYSSRPYEELLRLHGAAVASAMADAVAAALPESGVILIDDAHRLAGDAAYVTERVIAQARERSIHIVLFGRPEGMTRLLKVSGTSACAELWLQPLTQDEIRAAIAQRGTEADAVASALFERTKGFPLFFGRLVQRLRLDGVAGRERSLADEKLPDSVRALLEERLRERGDDAFYVAGAFAIDRRFTVDQLAYVLDWPEARVLDALDDLLALELLRESEEAPYLDFSHDVIAEAARDSLGAHRRRAVHTRAAAVLENAVSIGDLTRLAQHQAAAGQVATAAQTYIRAGDLAIEALQPRNALDLFDRSEALLARDQSRDARRIALRAALGKADALNLCSEPAKSKEISEKALPLAQAIGDEDLFLRLLLVHMRSMMRVDDIAAVKSDATRVLEMAEKRKDAMAEARACSALHFYYRMQLDSQAAHDWGARSAQCALQIGDVDFACLILLQMATAEGLFWRFDAAWDLWRQIDGLIGQGSQLVQAHYFAEKTRIHVQLERYDEAVVLVHRAIELFDSAPVGRCDLLADRQRCRLIADLLVANIALARRNWDEGVAISDQLLSSGPVRQSETVRANVVELAARLLAGRRGDGDLDRAWHLVCGIDQTAIPAEAVQYLRAAGALLAAAMGRPDARLQIRAALDESIRMSNGNPIEADVCFETLAGAARELGDAQLEAEASGLFERFNAMRRQAAGAAWGGASPAQI